MTGEKEGWLLGWLTQGQKSWRGAGGCCFFVLVTLLLTGTVAGDEPWKILKGRHFLVHYENAGDEAVAKRILDEAENYYRRIAEKLGFTRYSDFWTWDNRAKIFLYPDPQSFFEQTRQPLWSTGFSDRDSQVFQSRIIVTYKQEREFFDGLLPHEISHLIVHDFIPETQKIPIWLDEGIAQLAEAAKSSQARRIMKQLTREKRYIRLDYLAGLDIRRETDNNRATVFYAQSLSIVEFLIGRYGSDSFGRLCRSMRDGADFIEALRQATRQDLKTYQDLEKAWVKSLAEDSE